MPTRRLAYPILLALFLLTGLAGYFAAQLRFNYNFNDFYPAGDPDLAYYEQYAQRFGNDNDYVLLGLPPAGRTLVSQKILQAVVRSKINVANHGQN